MKNKWTKVQPTNASTNLRNFKLISSALDKICHSWCEVNPEYIPECVNVQYRFFNRPCDFVNFNGALSFKRDKSATGMNVLDYFMLKKLSLKYKLILLDIFKEMYASDCYPDDWRKSYVLFIDKPNNRGGVRPLSLSVSLCKLFESLIKDKLQ